MKNIRPYLLSFLLYPLTTQAVTVVVPAGTTQDGGDINTVVTQKVYGTADNFTVSGDQQVMSGGVTHNSIIYPYGQQDVEVGGTSYNTQVLHAGLQVVRGNSYSSTVESNGSINVNNGGNAYNTNVSGGSFSVLQGGNAYDTIVNSGTESVYGTDTNANIKGGTQQIKRYGKALNAQINGGIQQIDVRGTAENTVINSGIQNVYGDAISSVINSDGTMNVYSTGYAENTVISGGNMNVNSGVFSMQTILKQGTQTVYGQDISGTITGGTQIVLDGGVAEDTIIQGGLQQIGKDSYAFNNIISNSGIQEVEEGGYSYRSQISDGGKVIANGEVYEANIKNGGSLEVASGGLAQDTIVAGGSMVVAAGGTSQNTNLSSGSMTVAGTDTQTTLTGGTQTILAGGVAQNTNISGGEQIVQNGGTVQNATITNGLQTVQSGGVAENSQISAQGVQNILSGGKAQGSSVSDGGKITVAGSALATTVNANGSLEVASGGLAQDTTVAGGSMAVTTGGTSQNTNLSFGSMTIAGTDIKATLTGGTQTILAGGVAQNTNISGGEQIVQNGGTAQNSTVTNGLQTVQSGGVTENSQISAQGMQNILNGGKAQGSSVSDGGKITVAGSALSTKVNANGSLEVASGGLAQDTTVNVGGTAEFQSGSTATNTLIKGGRVNILAGAIAENTIINSGFEYVAGISNNASVNYLGSQTVQNGGVAYNTKVNASGTQNVLAGGEASHTIVNALGTQNVFQGAEVSDTQILLTGKQNVYAGGEAKSSTLYGGTQIVYGTASDTVVNSGLQEVKNGGKVISSQINYGGILTLLEGATAENTQLSNGTLRLFSGGNLIGSTSARNSILYISGNNSIPDLQSDNSLIKIGYNPSFTTLYINQLNGTGVFSMSSNLAAGISDYINVQDGDGNFGLIINDYSQGTAPDKFKIIDKSTAAHDSFYLVGGAVDVGAYRYDLVQENNDWFLEHTEQLSDATYVARNTFSAISSLFFSHLTPVYNRLHFQHQNFDHNNGLWIKGIGRRVNQNYKDGTSSRTDIYGESLGFDHQVFSSDGIHITAGLYSGFTSSQQKFDVDGQGDGQTYSFGLYSTLLTDNKYFLDVMGTYFRHHQKNRSYTPAGESVIAKFNTDGWQTALTAGKRFDFDNDWFLSPFLGMNYMYVQGVDYQTNFNTLIQADSADYLSNSLGFTGGKSFYLDSGVVLDAYSQVNMIYDWDAKSSVAIADYFAEDDLASLHYEFSLGLNATWNSHSSAYMEFTSQFGDKVDVPWAFSVGYQYNF